MLGHMYAAHLENDIPYPYIGLLVSGGHSIISKVNGSIGKRFYMDMLQLDEAEFELIQRARRGECLYKCGMERYHLEVKAPTHKAVLFGSAGGR